MADRDSNYTATGHDEETPPAAAGFKTEARPGGIIEGVLVVGSQCGVHGIGETDEGSNAETIGVFGESKIGTGVKGVAHESGDGVDGFSFRGRGVFGSSHFGNGVTGFSTEADGVIGSSSGEGKSGVFGFHTQSRGAVFGVSGTSESPQGAGVNGFSDHGGIGVRGFSATNDGVVGSSGSGNGVVGDSDSGDGVVGRSTDGFGAFFTSVSKEAVLGLTGGPGDGVWGRALGSGIGVRGEAIKGPGVFGDSEKQSGVVGRSRSAVAPGVFGICEQLTGVAGRSTSAPGVYGDSQKQAGVMGRSASSAGVFGFGDAAFQVSGPPSGVLGVNDKSIGVLGSSGQVIGVLGNTDKGLGVVGIANFGAGVPTDQITDQGIGVIGLGNSAFGVAGMSTSGTGVFGSSKTGLAGHFKGPVIIEGDVTIVGGTKSAAVPHPDGSHRQLYCVESPESWFEDFGQARLVNGKAEVRFDRGFAALVKLNGYHVFLTPYGDCKGMFVTKRAATGFRVCEQQGGTSNVRFAYRVVAKRKDVVARRLAKVTLPKVSKRSRRPDLRLKIKLPDFKRLSVTPFDLPSTLSKRKKPLGPTKRGNVKAPQYSAKKQS